jgi:putative ABC transport system permease protein
MDGMWRDVTYGARMLVRAPAFTLVAVLTLALGIGANTAIFSVIHAVLLKPLPYQEPDRLVYLTEWSPQVPVVTFSVANLKDLRDRSTVFEALAGYSQVNLVLTGEGLEARSVSVRQVTSGLFATLGKQPILGRAFTPEDDRPGAAPVALLSEGLWAGPFGRDPDVLGKRVLLSGESFTVVGVMPNSLHGSWKVQDVYTPLLRLEDTLGGEENRGNHVGIVVVARLKPGLSLEHARTEVASIARRLAEEYPATNAHRGMTVQPLLDTMVGSLRPALKLLWSAVGFVLLIACANVANLLLARAAGRQKEIAVRLSLGAKRSRVIRQLLTESVLLALAGGALGVLFAWWGVRALVAWLPTGIPRADEIGIDVPVLAFTAGLSLLTGLVFGLAPAWKVTAARAQVPLNEGGRGTVGARRHRLRDGLVVGEISLALVVLVGAGLLLRSFLRVVQTDPGFRAEGVRTLPIPLPEARYGDHVQRAAYAERLLRDVRALPGVRTAAITVPLLGGWTKTFLIEDRPEPPLGQTPTADVTRVTPDYFKAMSVPLLKGRAFDDRDRRGARPVCIVDELFVRTHFPGEEPLGKRLKFGTAGQVELAPWMEVVGVVAHVKNHGVDRPSLVELYLPYLQNSVSPLTVLVRADGDGAALGAALRQAVRGTDPDLPMGTVTTLDSLMAAWTTPRQFAVLLISVFAGLALSLAAVGIYGVVSYSVAQRTQEIGVRMAVGAGRDQIFKMVLRQGALMALLGTAIGLVAALGLARLIATMLFQTSAADPATLSIVALLLVAVALGACYAPARRAMRLDPQAALRKE